MAQGTGYLTLSDVFNPLDAALKVQSLEEGRKRNRLSDMALREALKGQADTEQFNNWMQSGMGGMFTGNPTEMVEKNSLITIPPKAVIPTPIEGTPSLASAPEAAAYQQNVGTTPFPMPQGGPQGVTPQSQDLAAPQQMQQPQLTPEQISSIKGQEVVKTVLPIVQKAFGDVENNGKRINKMSQMIKSNQNVQELFKTTSAKYDFGVDEDKKRAWFTVEKDFTDQDLKNLAQQYASKGGAVLENFNPGKYIISFDPVKGTITSAKSISADVFDKNLSEDQLINLMQNSKDPEVRRKAKGILDTIQNRRLGEARARFDIKSAGVDEEGLAESVANGLQTVSQIKGTMGFPLGAKIQSIVRHKYPKFDFAKNDANYKWQIGTYNQRILNQITGVLPRISMMAEQVNSLPNTTIPAINEVMRKVSIETGRPEYTNYEANRNAIVQEVNTALSGSAVGSDLRVRLELENLKSARAPEQLKGSLSNLNEALLARLDATTNVPYPLEVVQGHKTMQQFREETMEKYRKSFSPKNIQITTEAKGINNKTKEGWMKTIPKASLYKGQKVKDGKGNILQSDGTNWIVIKGVK